MLDYIEILIAIIKPRRNFCVTLESKDSRRNAGLITARKVHWPFQSNDRTCEFLRSSFDDVSSSLMTPSAECDTCHEIVHIIAERDETITEKSDKT